VELYYISYRGAWDFFPITRLNALNIQELEQSLECQFQNHFQAEEIEQLAHEKLFVQRKSKLNGMTFLSLIVFNVNTLHQESLNDLTVDLAQNYDIDITKQGLQNRFNACAVSFLKAALENLLKNSLVQRCRFRIALNLRDSLLRILSVFRLMTHLQHIIREAEALLRKRMSEYSLSMIF